MSQVDEIRLLRVWTPVILRSAVAASALLLVAGLAVIAATAPEAYVARYEALRQGSGPPPREDLLRLVGEAFHGQPRALLVVGLFVLTLVPIGRVAFAFAVFVHERDRLFAALTATVLALLGLGIFLGRVG